MCSELVGVYHSMKEQRVEQYEKFGSKLTMAAAL